MAKQNFLELTNRVLRRITQNEITDVTSVTGHSEIVTNLINEGQNAIFAEATNWHSLFKSRIFSTVIYNASTISFANANPDTINDSASGFGSFSSNQWVMVSGSSSNDGVYKVDTAAAGSLTLQTADALTVEAASNAISITAITYPVASDFGRALDLQNITNNTTINESYDRTIDELDPNLSITGTVTDFIFQDNAYRLYPIPSSVVKIRDRYWAIPTTLSANTDTSDLPIECENVLIYYAWKEVLLFLGSFEKADKVSIEYRKLLSNATIANDIIISKMHVMNSGVRNSRVGLPLLPAGFGRFR